MKNDLTVLLRKPVSDLELMERAAALLMSAGRACEGQVADR
jgi:hypothetical protein